MNSVKRVYVEKKQEFAVQAKELKQELKSYLGIQTVENVRVLIRYDIENISDATFETACNGIFSEPPVDILYKEEFEVKEGSRIFSVEYLPGQFDQRADSAVQCVQFIKEDEMPVIKSATTYVIEGAITDEEFAAIKAHCINPVDSRETGMEKPETLITQFEEPEDVKIFDGFKDMEEDKLKELYDSLGLAMTFKDFLHIQNYFKGEEKRDPSMTEIRVLDTYWSDHCRHTTFSTELKEVSFGEGDYKEPIVNAYKHYLNTHSEIFAGREDKFVCLMDLALMAMRKLKREGKLEDQEESDEINACSIVVPIVVDGVEEEWLVNFKNETHNHPTEIEPFGGAATCLGGAIMKRKKETKMNASVAIQTLPEAKNDEELIRIVDEVIAYIKSTGLNYYVGPFETAIEGDYDELMDIVKECQHIAIRAGAPSVAAYIKVTYKPEGDVLTIEKKVTKHHE